MLVSGMEIFSSENVLRLSRLFWWYVQGTEMTKLPCIEKIDSRIFMYFSVRIP